LVSVDHLNAMRRLGQDVQSVADFFFAEQLPPYDSAELVPKKGDAAMAKTVLIKAREVLATAEFTHDGACARCLT